MNFLAEMQAHVCHVCERRVLWDEFLLGRHLEREHGPMTVEDYYRQFVYPSEQRLRAKEEASSCQSSPEDIASDRSVTTPVSASPVQMEVSAAEQQEEMNVRIEWVIGNYKEEETEEEIGDAFIADSDKKVEEGEERWLLSEQEVALLLDDSDLCQARPNSIRMLEYPKLRIAYDK